MLSVSLMAMVVLLIVGCGSAQAVEPIRGGIGVGTWATQAEFKDIRVSRDGQTLFRVDQRSGLEAMQAAADQWESEGKLIRQTSDATPSLAVTGEVDWIDYTLSLKARKLSGDEGFLIAFGVDASGQKSWWNVGGWGNTQHQIEVPGVPCPRVPGRIETGRWYDIRITLDGERIRAYLDGKLIHDVQRIPPQRDFGKALIPDLVADPSVNEFDGTFYLYGTTDGMGQGLATAGPPVVWRSKDFVHWRFQGSIIPDNFDAKYWAPSRAVHKDGRYFLFPTLDNRITAVVSDSPEGPFKTLDGRDIHPGSGWQQFPIDVGHPIDAEVFLDDDGSYYMMWSQRYIAKLSEDFTGFDGPPVEIATKRGGYSEGPYMFKRRGIYYYLYTLGGSEGYQYAYMTSRESPLGPWEAPEQDIVSTTDHEAGVFGPGHGCFFNPQGTDDWYFVHLEYGRGSTNRHVLAQRMRFNRDGSIQPIRLSLDGVGKIRSDPDYETPNLAEAGIATASSVHADVNIPSTNDARLNRLETFGPENAVDGSNGSRWMAGEDDAHAWYQLDLGRPCDIKRVELFFVRPTLGHAFTLEHSPDGESWETYGGDAEIQMKSPHKVERDVKARFLRLTVVQGTPGLWEFCVY